MPARLESAETGQRGVGIYRPLRSRHIPATHGAQGVSKHQPRITRGQGASLATRKAKDASKTAGEGLPLHSFRTLPRDLATLTYNAPIIITSRPTALQEQGIQAPLHQPQLFPASQPSRLIEFNADRYLRFCGGQSSAWIGMPVKSGSAFGRRQQRWRRSGS